MIEFEIKNFNYSSPHDPEQKPQSEGSCPEKIINVETAERDQFSSWGQTDGANKKRAAEAKSAQQRP